MNKKLIFFLFFSLFQISCRERKSKLSDHETNRVSITLSEARLSVIEEKLKNLRSDLELYKRDWDRQLPRITKPVDEDYIKNLNNWLVIFIKSTQDIQSEILAGIALQEGQDYEIFIENKKIENEEIYGFKDFLNSLKSLHQFYYDQMDLLTRPDAIPVMEFKDLVQEKIYKTVLAFSEQSLKSIEQWKKFYEAKRQNGPNPSEKDQIYFGEDRIGWLNFYGLYSKLTDQFTEIGCFEEANANNVTERGNTYDRVDDCCVRKLSQLRETLMNRVVFNQLKCKAVYGNSPDGKTLFFHANLNVDLDTKNAGVLARSHYQFDTNESSNKTKAAEECWADITNEAIGDRNIYFFSSQDPAKYNSKNNKLGCLQVKYTIESPDDKELFCKPCDRDKKWKMCGVREMNGVEVKRTLIFREVSCNKNF